MGHKDYFIRSAIDFAFRRRHPALALIGFGVTMFGLLLAGMAASLEVPLSNGAFRLSFSMEGGAGLFSYAALILAVLLILGGLGWLYNDWKQADRRRIFAIEFRGLRDWKGAPLVDAVPPGVEGRRVEVAIDMRQRVADGLIVSPDAALERLMPLRTILDQHEDGRNRADSTFIVGGIAPVPLSFLAGILLDDEAPMAFYDWDRDAKLWSELKAEDDGERFVIEGLAELPATAQEVIVTVAASYRVDETAALARAGNLPVVRLTLPTTTTNNHWSEDKQQALARMFLDTMTELKGRGVQKVHLFFAGANSLVLRFGSVYDKRNLPALTVYQYESSAFTWGVNMPVAGRDRPSVAQPASD